MAKSFSELRAIAQYERQIAARRKKKAEAEAVVIYTTTIRLPYAQAQRVIVAAQAADISMAQWLRRAVAEKLEREAANHRQIEDELTAMTAALEVTK